MASWWKRRYALQEVQFQDDLFTDPLVFQCTLTTHAKTSVRLLSQVQIWCRQENLLVQDTSKKHVTIKHEISENCHKTLKSYKFALWQKRQALSSQRNCKWSGKFHHLAAMLCSYKETEALHLKKFVDQHFEVLYFLIVFQTVCESLSSFVTNMIMLLFFSLSRRSFIPHYWR